MSIAADTRVFTFADVTTGQVLRSAAFDVGHPPFSDPHTFELLLGQLLDSVSPHLVPRVRLEADSGRPAVLAQPVRQVQLILPDEDYPQAIVDAANRQIAQHPFVEVSLLKVPR